MSCLLKRLRLLQSLDELELFSLHASDISFVLGLLPRISIQFLLNLHGCAILALHKVHLALLRSLLLLRLDHVLHVLSASQFLSTLLVFAHAGHLLLSLRLLSNLLLLHRSRVLTSIDFGSCLVLDCSGLLALDLLIHLLLTGTFLFCLLIHHIALPLRHNLIGTVPCLINFLVHLLPSIQNMVKRQFFGTYLAFFHLKKTDSVTEQLEVFLSSLTSSFGSDEFPVKGGIVVIFVGCQVHLIHLIIKFLLLR